MIGMDAEADQLRSLLISNQINTDYLVNSSARITTNKIRIMGRNQQMMRLDAEMVDPLLPDDESKLILSFENYIRKEKPSIVILEDYNKGILTATVIRSVIALCRQHHILTAVDPKRKNFFQYEQVDIFKPNLHEAKEGLNIINDEVTEQSLMNIHAAIHEKLKHQISLVTLSEKGVFYQQGDQHRVIPTHIRNIADVSGAGDTVIAVSAVIYAATKNVQVMAEIANIAGGLVCEEVGTVAINKERLLAECKYLLNG
jgi:rfaE bifunctional protein kinase chain/domain